MYTFEIPRGYQYGIGKECFWCGCRVIYLDGNHRQPPTRATRDHLITRMFRPKGIHSPIVLSCRQCNAHRGISMAWLPERPTEIAQRFVEAFATQKRFIISWRYEGDVSQFLVVS